MGMFRDIDDLLRGRFTDKDALRRGEIPVGVGTLVKAGAILGAVYGIFMGLYGALRPESADFRQLIATTLKLPLLFLLTLAVTLPSLYVFAALSDSKLGFGSTLRLLLAATTVNLALLASLGPVTAFFTLSTDSYPFMIVLNVLFCAVAGLAGLFFLRRALLFVFEGRPPAQPTGAAESADEDAVEPPPRMFGMAVGEIEPPDPVRRAAEARAPARASQDAQARARLVFRAWMVIYGVVGAQMGWILRPFIGAPNRPFEWFRERDSNFFTAFMAVLRDLLT